MQYLTEMYTHTTYSKTRSVAGSVDGIREGLEWAGLNYDFGAIAVRSIRGRFADSVWS
jgi:hypothetical protein